MCFVVVLFNVQVGLGVLLDGERKEGHRGGDTHWVKVRNMVCLFSFLSMRSVECVLCE